MSTEWIPIDKFPPHHRDEVIIWIDKINRWVKAKLWYDQGEFPLGFTYYDIGGKTSIDFREIKYWMPAPISPYYSKLNLPQ